MTLARRPGLVVRLVNEFGQLSSTQIHELVFHGLKSRTPCYRTLKRLVDDQYLVPVQHRIVGGAKGGSGQYAYALGRHGFYMHNSAEYKQDRRVNFHSLAVADAYLSIVRMQRAGQLEILNYQTEPNAWAYVEEIQLRPDLAVDFSIADRKYPRLWLEVDLDTEGAKQIRTKLEAYWQAYQVVSTENEDHRFPFVLWVAIDEARARELRWIIGEASERAQGLFRVCTLDQLPATLLATS